MKVFEKDFASVFRQIDDVIADFPTYEHWYERWSNSSTKVMRKVSLWRKVEECRLSLSITAFGDSISKSATIHAHGNYNRSLIRLIGEALEKQGFEVSLEVEK